MRTCAASLLPLLLCSPAAATTPSAPPPTSRPTSAPSPSPSSRPDARLPHRVRLHPGRRPRAQHPHPLPRPQRTQDADATLRGTILTQTSRPLTYDSSSGQTSSYLITITAKVVLTARDGRVLYENDAFPSASSTSPPRTSPPSSRKTRPPSSASPATSPRPSSPTCWSPSDACAHSQLRRHRPLPRRDQPPAAPPRLRPRSATRAFLYQRCRHGILAALAPPDQRDFCLHDLDLADTTIFDILDLAQTPSLMAPFQVIFVRNLKTLYGRGCKKEEFAAIDAYFRRPNPAAVLLFVADHLSHPHRPPPHGPAGQGALRAHPRNPRRVVRHGRARPRRRGRRRPLAASNRPAAASPSSPTPPASSSTRSAPT